jgi:hypothetical protein
MVEAHEHVRGFLAILYAVRDATANTLAAIIRAFNERTVSTRRGAQWQVPTVTDPPDRAQQFETRLARPQSSYRRGMPLRLRVGYRLLDDH